MSDIVGNSSLKAGEAHVIDEKILFRGSWSEIVEFSYEDDKKQIRKWEGMHRKYRTEAVIIVAQMKPSGRFIIIRQFRPPTNSYILEFPAGLVDPGESLETTAIRELLEETGYVGRVVNLSPRLFSSPGIISEMVSFVHVHVDENVTENLNPKPENEPGEFIAVFVKSPEEISEFFKQEKKQGVQFDVNLYSYFMDQGLL